MGNGQKVASRVLCILLAVGFVGCSKPYYSSFAAQAMKPSDVTNLKYRVLKTAAVGESSGFKFLWIPFVSPTEAEAKRDMLDRLKKEGIETNGKNIGFMNATGDKGGFGFIGLIGAPAITLTADVIEILGEPPSAAVQPQN